MIKNGRPFSNENGYTDDKLMEDLSAEDQEKIMNWIRDNIQPRKTPNTRHTSYGLKHIQEHDTKIYLTNNQFKDAMMKAGYMPVNELDLNWTYRISEKSPAFRKGA